MCHTLLLFTFLSLTHAAAAGVPTVAMVFGGDPQHNKRGALPHSYYCKQIAEHLLAPLLSACFRVGIFAACDTEEQANTWEQAYMVPLAARWKVLTAQAAAVESEVSREESMLLDEACKPGQTNCVGLCPPFFGQVAHLDAAWWLARRFERGQRVHFTHVVRARSDLMYRPTDVLLPAWITHAPPSAVLISSTEFDGRDRWWERPEQQNNIMNLGFPSTGINDQFAFGERKSMEIYLQLVRPNGTIARKRMDGKGCIRGTNRWLAERLHSAGLRIMTVELQYGAPGHRPDRFILGNPAHKRSHGEAWIQTPCRKCWNISSPPPANNRTCDPTIPPPTSR